MKYKYSIELNGFALRLIAMVTMLIDHIGQYILHNPYMVIIGRIAFPVYAYLLVDGCLKTDEFRQKKHVIFLTSLMILSEPCFDFMRGTTAKQNVMVALCLGYAFMLFAENLKGKYVIQAFLAIGACLISAYLKADYGIAGPFLIIMFYYYLKTDVPKNLLTMCGIFVLWVPLLGISWKYVIGYACAAVILSLYNGKLGYHSKWFSWIYKTFYPVHMMVIGLIG